MTVAPRPVTELLARWRGGDEAALQELLPLVYDELRRIASRQMARERPGHTLQTTALVNEAYARLVTAEVSWTDRAHFFAVAARAMRRVLVDHARARRSAKRGGGAAPSPLEAFDAPVGEPLPDLLDLDRALEGLAREDPVKARRLELHYFAGLGHDDLARLENVSVSTVRRDLRFALARLRLALAGK
jgi:RNA polymerase sigma factor (TIGR02999 family)